MKNLNDIEIIRNLELEIGCKLEKYSGSFDRCYFLDTNDNVVELYLINLELNSFPQSILRFKKLRKLSLYNNNIKELPVEIITLRYLEFIDLDKNPINNPPFEIVIQGYRVIFEYLKQVAKGKNITLIREAKLLLLGQGDVGKTCLANRLKFDEFIEAETTLGINILGWKINSPDEKKEEIQLNIWDFGGQEIYHATHQFFLTKRSIYIIVWNARKSKDYDNIYKWLYISEAYGSNSPMILVLTKKNQRNDDLNMKELKERFPELVDLIKVDSQNGEGFSELKKLITDVAWKLPQMNEVWLESWLKVRSILEGKNENYIHYNDYIKICSDEKIDESESNILSEYLHHLGVFLHFKDNFLLKRYLILKPKWATDAVYKVIDSQMVIENQGILKHMDLKRIWEDSHEYPEDIFPILLELMNSFELAYRLPESHSSLVPERLNSIEPYFEWLFDENLRFIYKYDFLPEGILTRFIVRIHQEIERTSSGKDLCWREGVIINKNGARALVKQKREARSIEIIISGSGKRELLAIIRREFDHINKSFNKINIEKQIPCNCSVDCTKMHDYEKLLIGEYKHAKTILCDVTWNEIPLSILLDGYDSKDDRNEINKIYEILKVKNIKVDLNLKIIDYKSDIYLKRLKEYEEEKKEKENKEFWKRVGSIIIGISIDLGMILGAIELYKHFTVNSSSTPSSFYVLP